MSQEPFECHSEPRADRIDREDILLLINKERRLSRDAICRLGGNLDGWLNRPCTPHTAKDIGVQLSHLEIARQIADSTRAEASNERGRLEAASVMVLFSFESSYPSSLHDLELPPPVLYVRGCLDAAPCFSIVGPRRPDPWASEVTRWFARDLAAAGLTIVSGFARGVDRLAHESAMEAFGRTLAILGCGIDVDYPRGSNRLKEAISQNGAMVSEFSPGTTPRPYHFPIRNRLIAALGFATLVIQADLRSGSLITARLALDTGRDVFAVPGRPFDQKSRGSNALLRDGAHVALAPEQILELLPTAIRDALDRRESTGREESTNRKGPLAVDGVSSSSIDLEASKPAGLEIDLKILECIEAEQLPPQKIAQSLGLEVGEILAVLTRLEITGRIRRCPGGTFLKSR